MSVREHKSKTTRRTEEQVDETTAPEETDREAKLAEIDEILDQVDEALDVEPVDDGITKDDARRMMKTFVRETHRGVKAADLTYSPELVGQLMAKFGFYHLPCVC